MKMSVTQLRVLVLVLNILVAAGVPAFAYYGYTRGGSIKEKAKIEELSKFLPGREAGTMPNSAGRVAIVATWLQPRPPAAIGDLPPKEKDGTPGAEATTVPRGPDGLEAGPLAEQGWEYHFYLLRSNPLHNYVILKKKDAANPLIPAGTLSSASKTGQRIRPPARGNLRGKGTGNIKVQGPSDQISFHIEKREFKDDELGLHFMIHSSDRNQFVYWMSAEPKKRYALPFTHESQYDKNPSDGLRPPEKSADEKTLEDGVKKVNPFIYRTPDWESQREKDYQDALDGKINLQTTSGPSKPDAPQAGTGLSRGASSRTPGGPGTPRPPTVEEKQKLEEAIKAIPKDKQKELIDGLKKAGQNNLK